MIKKILRKLNFLLLRSSVGSFLSFNRSYAYGMIDQDILKQNAIKLNPHYQYYIQHISSADMAASLELASFIYSICTIKKYTRLLDMGSGFSSFVFRLYASSDPNVMVYSIDDDALWLQKTKDYLTRNNLNVDNMYDLEHFLESDVSGFDCILYDMNFVEVRINYIEQVMGLAARGGLVIMDDVHKPDYFYALLKKLKGISTNLYSLKQTTFDQFGRFALAVIKN